MQIGDSSVNEELMNAKLDSGSKEETPSCGVNILKMIDSKKGYGRKTDIWSLGISLVEMSLGKLPFRNGASAIFRVCVSKVRF